VVEPEVGVGLSGHDGRLEQAGEIDAEHEVALVVVGEAVVGAVSQVGVGEQRPQVGSAREDEQRRRAGVKRLPRSATSRAHVATGRICSR
jgi:hypothetical protein